MLLQALAGALGCLLILCGWWAVSRSSNCAVDPGVGVAVMVGWCQVAAAGVLSPRPDSPLAYAPGTATATQLSGPVSTQPDYQPAYRYSTPEATPLVTLPSFPIPTPKILVTPAAGEPEPDTSAVARIIIPALLLDTVVKYVPFDGQTWYITGLRQEVAWLGDTSHGRDWAAIRRWPGT
jgi:hypothetical protein